MFIITLRYIAPLDEVDAHRPAHQAWIRAGIAEGWLIFAGRKVPPDGGILIAVGEAGDVAARAATDPFVLHGVAAFDIVEFTPTLAAPALEWLLP